MSTQQEVSRRRNSRRRDERHARLGAGFSDGAKKIENAGTGIDAPVTAAEVLDRVTLVCEIEFFNAYPNGVLFDTGIIDVQMVTAGDFTVNGPGVAGTFDMTVNTPANQIHTVVAYFEVRTVGTGLAVIHLDGLEVARSEVGTFTAWGTIGATWDYMNGITEIGNVSVLEVFPGFRPATVVG